MYVKKSKVNTKKLITILICSLAAMLSLISVIRAFALDKNMSSPIWYDSGQIQTVGDDIYNDGSLQVTSSIEGKIASGSGKITVNNKIKMTNLTSASVINIESVQTKLNSGFESANISNWTVKNSSETLFSGGSTTTYKPGVNLNPGSSKEYSVTTDLASFDAGKLGNTNPFMFVYTYNISHVATIDTTEGICTSGVPSGWTKTSNTTYTKSFPENTSYSSILGEWYSATILHSEYPDICKFNGFSPDYGSLTKDTTFYAQYGGYRYAVCIWGIEHDGAKTITFGPAVGPSSSCLDVNGEHLHCIHNDSWDEIISNIKNGHADYYQDCLSNSCTKDVVLSNNTTIMASYPTYLKRCSTLYNYIVGKGRDVQADDLCYACFSNSINTSDCQSVIWFNSRLRATLNGYNNLWDPFTPNSYATNTTSGTYQACCTKDNCLFSSFPKVLQNNIKEKTYQVITSYNCSSSQGYPITSSKIIKDKLWLPSGIELFGTNGGSAYLLDYGSQYQKMINVNAKWYPSGSRQASTLAYNEDKSPNAWWNWSPRRLANYTLQIVNENGVSYGNSASRGNCGISPFFCLG